MELKLSGWKAFFLSLAGRITIAKSVLTAMETYYMQSTLLPQAICDQIEAICRRFIWGSTREHKKIHLVGWEKVKKAKQHGGLTIQGQRRVNDAFLMKLI